MFDSLALENPKRKWATLMSFTLETALVGMLIAAPLAFTDKLQTLHFGDRLVAPLAMSSEPSQPVTHSNPSNTNRSEMTPEGNVIAPSRIPPTITPVVDEGPVTPPGVGVPDGVPWSSANNQTMNSLMRTLVPRAVSVTPAAPRALVRISVLDAGFLVHRVQPVYPRNAIITHTEGTVVLTAVIDTTGRITQLHVVSGHPLLINAAMDAVRQWRYKPYVLNGSAVEVETQVSVVFNLNSH